MMALRLNSMNVEDNKMMRAFERSRSLRKKRAEYDRLQAERESGRAKAEQETDQSRAVAMRRAQSVPVAIKQAKPHRAVRAAARTWFTQGLVDGATDFPTISMGKMGFSARKPSVSQLLPSQKRVQICTGIDSDVDTTASEGLSDEDCKFEVRSYAVESVATLRPSSARRTEDNVKACQEIIDQTVVETKAIFPTLEHVKSTSSQCQQTVEPKVSKEKRGDEDVKVLPQREHILRNVVAALREQVQAADKEARVAKARVEEMELKVIKKRQTRKTTSLKSAVIVERQRAAHFRKQRNQSVHVQAMKEHAERTLKKAVQQREQAEADALAAHAQLLGKVSTAAQVEVEARLQAQALMEAAQVEAEVLRGQVDKVIGENWSSSEVDEKHSVHERQDAHNVETLHPERDAEDEDGWDVLPEQLVESCMESDDEESNWRILQ
eukprot:TRINITY_DN26988_c1_g9_i1.p1 TRINITY_DN26988_c1_g9~~TRINITY_DN26988_c1_g9_i1.p1  ORF type:complete len:438 (-),score=86.13 TRINITY_DN26988_c1_g9_i1:387-1700(-)